MDNLETSNQSDLLDILDGLRRRVVDNELLQLFVVVEDAEGFNADWTGTEDRFSIAGFALGAILQRMGFAKVSESD